MENTKAYLLKFGIKPSVQRLAVMNYLLTHKTHPCVEDIFNDLYPSIPTLSKTTVYNTLNLLSKSGACQQLTIDDKCLRFDGELLPHSHFMCKQCGKIIDVPSYVEMPNRVAEHKVTGMQVYYSGICMDCEKSFN